MGYATRHPANVARFIIFNTAAFVLKKLPKRILICRPRQFGAMLVRGFNAFAGVATWQAVTRPMSPPVRAGYLAPYNNWANRVAIHNFVMDIPGRMTTPPAPCWPKSMPKSASSGIARC
jgi:haloalkane dehalogenase